MTTLRTATYGSKR